MPTSIVGNRRQRGFTYAVALASAVALAIAAGGAHLLQSRIQQADREAELLYRGQVIRNAIAAYYRDHQRYPQRLEDLVRDPSSASRRYLRAPYGDPMAQQTKSAKLDSWKTFESADGGVNGVASQSKAVPLKHANFPPEFEKFSEAESYSDWIFMVLPPRSEAGRTGVIPNHGALDPIQ